MTPRKQKLVVGLAIIGVILLIGPSIIFPGSGLVPNATLDSEHLWGWGSNQYVAKLGTGTWTVSVSSSSFWGLQFDIHVTTGLFLLPYSLASDVSGGKSVTFTLNESAVVHIKVIESSVYHDSSGFYSIRITGDGESFDSFFPLALNFIAFMIVISFAVPLLMVACFCASARNQQGRLSSVRRRITETGYELPRRRSRYEDGSNLRTPRLPSKCPTCGADMSDSNIDWTGPMEATCLHCGAVVQAKFERI